MRLLEPAQVAAGDVQLVQPVGHVRVVLQDAAVLGLPCAPRPEQPTLRRRERPEDELRGVENLADALDELGHQRRILRLDVNQRNRAHGSQV